MPSSKKRPNAAGDEGGGGKKPGKKKQQMFLTGKAGVQKVDKAHTYLGDSILVSDKIFGQASKIPEDYRGKLFDYEVIGYNTRTKEFKIQYKNWMIKEDGVKWEPDEDGDSAELDHFKIETIEEGVEEYQRAIGHVNAALFESMAVTENTLAKAGTESAEDVDTTDLEEAARTDPKGWYSEAVLLVDFELTGEKSTTPGGIPQREWKSRHCDFSFFQDKNTKSDSWHTGIWKRKLESVASGKGKGVKNNIKAMAKAQFILDMREKCGKNAPPVKGMPFFDFEENLDYQIQEGQAIISTGSVVSFFDNPFVRSLLTTLNPRHKVVYRSKLAKLVRCINDVMYEEIHRIVMELFLLYIKSFVASNSDFWWDPSRKLGFGACVGCFIANHYKFKNGLSLAMSDLTLKEMQKDGTDNVQLMSTVPNMERCQALLDFKGWSIPKTGENIGAWLNDIHGGVGIQPDYIGSHVVDGASNATSSAETLAWQTSDERSQTIITDNCDAHKANTTAGQASGTSGHATNLNPELGSSLDKLHDWMGSIGRSGERQGVVNHVQVERSREKYPRNRPAVVTRWGGRHEETRSANCNQADLDTAIRRMVSIGGVDEALFNVHNAAGTLASVLFGDEEWNLFQQYESALQPLRDFNLFTQSSKVNIHNELFEAQRAMELLRSPWFVMYENVSKRTGIRAAKDLTKRPKNQLVTQQEFIMMANEFSAEYEKMTENDMICEIELARRVAWRILRKRLNIVKPEKTLTNRNQNDYDADTSLPLMIALEDVRRLPDLKIMGAIVNPLMQNKVRMVESGICTEPQYDRGHEELLRRLTHYYERKASEVVAKSGDATPEYTNKWSLFVKQKVEDTPRQRAVKELDKFVAMCDACYLPEMEPTKVLGAIDEDGQPKEPVYAFGKVKKKRAYLSDKRNHADYVDEDGYYDIVRFFNDFKTGRDALPALANVVIGQFCPHVTAEVDCESLFSQAGIIADPRRAKTGIRMYERLVVGKHRIHRIYCSIPRVKKLFLERWRNNSWDEQDVRDDREFLEVEKQIYLDMFPHNAELVGDEEEGEEEGNNGKAGKNKKKKGKKGKKKKEVEVIDDSEGDEEDGEVEIDC